MIDTDIQADRVLRCVCYDDNDRYVTAVGIDSDGNCEMPPNAASCVKDWLCPNESQDPGVAGVLQLLNEQMKNQSCPDNPEGICEPSGDVRFESAFENGGALSLRDCTYSLVQDCEYRKKCPTPAPK